MAKKQHKRGRITFYFLRVIENSFKFIYPALIGLGIGAFFAVVVYFLSIFFKAQITQFLPNTDVEKISLNAFSIFAGFATFLGVILAIAELRLTFEKITRWDNLLYELKNLVDDAEKYVAMFTWYPSVGMGTMKNKYGFDKKYVDFRQAINIKFKTIPIIGIFLSEANRKPRVFNIADRFKITNEDNSPITEDNNPLIRECDSMINVLKNCMVENGKLVAELDFNKMGCVHMIFSEKEGIIFTPLNLDYNQQVSNGDEIEFIGNVTLDLSLIKQFEKTVKYYNLKYNLNIYTPF
jgi:hypothetical protein